MKLAQDKLDEARRGREIIERAREVFRHAQIKHDTVVDRELLRGEKMVREADERTVGYQKSMGSSPSVTFLSGATLGSGGGLGGSVVSSNTAIPISAGSDVGSGSGSSGPLSWRDAPGVVVPVAFPAGFALVPVGSIADTDPVAGSQDFDSGQDLPTLKWSANALLDVVLPALIGAGADLDSVRVALSEKDLRQGLSGERTYSRTLDGFFGDISAMKVGYTPAAGFDLQNGRHRLWLLKRLGAEQVPVRVSGAGS
ncbi:hypothetical protein [Tsukamurella sp. NPDC003166]|uniref:hypothetical protein n=1 Tax=Tsukamurella sp. NPDC003166 TaxID=3154444 RepID=UPI0033A4B42C